MIDAETFFDQFVLQGNHVGIFVMRETHVQAIAGLAGFAVAYAVTQNDEVFAEVEKLSGAEENGGELLLKKLPAGAAGAMKDQDGVGDFAARVARGLA